MAEDTDTGPGRELTWGETVEARLDALEAKGKGGKADDGADATDAAKKLAADEGVDLSQVQGTGDGGRIGKPDVEKYLADKADTKEETK